MAKMFEVVRHETALSAETALTKDAVVVLSATLFMALCAHVSFPLVFSPVPLTLQTFGVLLISFTLGGKRAFAALALYLVEGIAGLPVFSPTGPGGIAQFAGPTGGFLMSYPVAAFVGGWLFDRKQISASKIFASGIGSAIAAECIIFASGLAWLKILTGMSMARVATMAVAPFIPGEILKISAAVALASQWKRFRTRQS